MKSYVPFLFFVVALAQCEAGLLQNLGHVAKTAGEGIKNGTMKAEVKIKEFLHLGKMEMETADEATTVQTPPEQPFVPPVQNGMPSAPVSKTRTSITSIPRCAPGETFSDGACRTTSIAELD